MVTIKNFFFIIATIVLTVALFFFLFPNEEKQIKKQLNRLTEYATKEQDEPTLTSLTKSAQIGALFAETCTLKISNPNIEGRFTRKEITDRITLTRRSFTWLTVSFYDITIHFPVETTAENILTMRLHGKMGNEDIADVQEVSITMQKQEGKWLITGIEIVEVLEQ